MDKRLADNARLMDNRVRHKISVNLGDITDADTDAIVNAANNELILGGGVAGAIRQKGGPEIQSECDRIGCIHVGRAAITCAGDLKCKYVIHAASMRLGGTADAESLRNSMRHAFELAAANGVRSVAVPAVGAGIAGFPVRRCAEILMNEAAQALRKKEVEKVRFYLIDQTSYDAFFEAYRALGD